MTTVFPHGRVLVTSVALAAALITGTWIVVDMLDRPHVNTIDAALVAEAIAERHAAQTYSPVPITQTLWTAIEHVPTGGTNEVWGGYQSVDISSPSLGVLAGTYHYARRSRYEPNCVPDRGFCDVYTNAYGRRLIDIGPSGGGAVTASASGGGMRSGWVLRDGSFLARDYALPPGFHLSTGWFLAGVYNEGWITWMQARGHTPTWYAAIDPSTISVTPGPIDPLRLTYWTPTTPGLATNILASLPTYDETWFSGHFGDWTGGATPPEVWTNKTTASPLIICRPRSGWSMVGTLSVMIQSIANGHYVDSTLATTPPDDFDGFVGDDLPPLNSNADFLSRLATWNTWAFAGTNRQFMFATQPFIDMGQSILMAKSHICDSYWTNIVTHTYHTSIIAGDDFDDALAEAIAAPDWSIHSTQHAAFSPDTGPGYTVFIVESGPYPWGPGSGVRLGWSLSTATLVALPGLGHGIQGHHAIAAHVRVMGGLVPSGETVIPAGRTNDWIMIARQTGTASPDVTMLTLPSHTSAPDYGLLSHLSESTVGWWITATRVCATPDWLVE